MNNLNIITGAAVVAATMASPLVAADDHGIDSRWYVAPQARYVIADDERLGTDGSHLDDDGYGLELNFGRQISHLLNFEFNLFGDKFEQDTNNPVDNNTELNQFGAGVNFLVVPKRTGFQPFASLGAGALWTQGDAVNSPNEGQANPYGEIGLGAFIPVTAHGTKIRFEAKHRAARNDDLRPDEKTYQDTIVTLGMQIPFGAKKAPVVAVVPVTPVDSDNDGVPNGQDLCPNTPAGVRVGKNGCGLDSDNDGVLNAKDLCPNTPAGTQVNANGCPRDSDNDGIVDDRDLCPNTAAGTRVDSTGCEIKDVITLKGVNFELNSAKLLAISTERLNGAVATLNRYPDTNVLIAGHTDSSGAASYNLDLSKRRAKSVETYLIRNGVNPNQLTTQGYGETQPVATNSNRTGRALNRRVELRIQK